MAGGMHGRGRCAWQGGMHGRGFHAWQWGMHGGACVTGGNVCGRGGMHGGACVTGGNVCGRGGMCGRGGGMHGRRDGHCSRRHTSYWNAFLLPIYFKYKLWNVHYYNDRIHSVIGLHEESQPPKINQTCHFHS